MKKVLIYRSSYLPISETFISDHIKNLKQYTPVVLCEHEITASHKADIEPYKLYKTKIGKKIYDCFGYSKAFNNLLAAENPDIIHAHFLTDAAKILPLVERVQIPFVVTAHGYDASIYDEYMAQSPEGQLLLSRRSRLIKRVDKVFCVSELIKKELLNKGFPESKLEVSYLGIDINKLGVSAIEQTVKKGILFVGRLVEKKGAEYLLKAYAKLPQDLKTMHPLDIIGDGPLMGALQQLAKDLQIKPNFHGALPRNDVLKKLQATSLFVLPSVRAANGDSEGMPIAIMEAQAFKVPVCIFDDQPTAPLILQYEAGLLAKSKDVNDMALKIEQILSDNSLSERFIANGFKLFTEKFDLFKNVGYLEDSYEQVCQNHLKK